MITNTQHCEKVTGKDIDKAKNLITDAFFIKHNIYPREIKTLKEHEKKLAVIKHYSDPIIENLYEMLCKREQYNDCIEWDYDLTGLACDCESIIELMLGRETSRKEYLISIMFDIFQFFRDINVGSTPLQLSYYQTGMTIQHDKSELKYTTDYYEYNPEVKETGYFRDFSKKGNSDKINNGNTIFNYLNY